MTESDEESGDKKDGERGSPFDPVKYARLDPTKQNLFTLDEFHPARKFLDDNTYRPQVYHQ